MNAVLAVVVFSVFSQAPQQAPQLVSDYELYVVNGSEKVLFMNAKVRPVSANIKFWLDGEQCMFRDGLLQLGEIKILLFSLPPKWGEKNFIRYAERPMFVIGTPWNGVLIKEEKVYLGSYIRDTVVDVYIERRRGIYFLCFEADLGEEIEKEERRIVLQSP